MEVGSWWGQVRHFKLAQNIQESQGNKKADGKDAHRQAGGSQAPVFLQRDLSAAFCWQTAPPSILPASSVPKQWLQGSSSPFVILPEWERTQVSSRCLSGANSAPWFNPSPSARGRQGGRAGACRAHHHHQENKWIHF